MTFDQEGWCYAGGNNGSIYVWGLDRTVARSIKAHSNVVTTLTSEGSYLISGSKDFKVALITVGNGTFKLEKMIDLAPMTEPLHLNLSYPQSLDMREGSLLIGLKNGTLMEIKKDHTEARVVSQSHFMGEVWGLHVVDDNRVLTCGDDNRIMLFDTQKKVFAQGASISSKKQ